MNGKSILGSGITTTMETIYEYIISTGNPLKDKGILSTIFTNIGRI